MEHLSTQVERRQIEWRRAKVLELSSQGHSQREIADTIHVGIGTINRDMTYLRNEAQENLKTHIQDKIPEEYQNCMVGINQVLKICWEIVNKSRNMDNDNGNGRTMTVIDNKTTLQALTLINDCNKYKMDLTNGVVITDAIKFVQTNREKLTMSKEEDGKESKEPDYDEDKDQLEEKQEEETGERETTNQVF
jgi:hypothetical protein